MSVRLPALLLCVCVVGGAATVEPGAPAVVSVKAYAASQRALLTGDPAGAAARYRQYVEQANAFLAQRPFVPGSVTAFLAGAEAVMRLEPDRAGNELVVREFQTRLAAVVLVPRAEGRNLTGDQRRTSVTRPLRVAKPILLFIATTLGKETSGAVDTAAKNRIHADNNRRDRWRRPLALLLAPELGEPAEVLKDAGYSRRDAELVLRIFDPAKARSPKP